MPPMPQSIQQFFSAGRIAVAGVSRQGNQPANAIFKKLRNSGHDVIAVNPNATEIEGEPCFPDLASIPGDLGALMIVSHPEVSADLVRQAAARGIKHVWFHRSFGDGSVSAEAIRECERIGIVPIVGGCPMMYCAPVDIGHRCFRWWLGLRRRVPV